VTWPSETAGGGAGLFYSHANIVVKFATLFVRNIPYIIQDFKSYS